MTKDIYNKLGIAVWVIYVLFFITTIYVNKFLPHGPMINTGYDCVEMNDGRTTKCGDQFIEDTRNLDIPGWAKFLREHAFLLFIGIPILAAFLQTKGGKEFNEK